MDTDADLILVILAVSNLERSVEFYRSAFGWEQSVDAAPTYAELLAPPLSVGLYLREGFGRNTNRPPVSVPEGELAPLELYLRVADLEASIERLEAAGARRLADPAPKEWGDTVAYFADPDGNVIAVARSSGGAGRERDESPPYG